MKNLLITLGSILLVVGGIAGFTLKANADKSNDTEIIDHEASVEDVDQDENDTKDQVTETEDDENSISEKEDSSEISDIKDFDEYKQLKEYVDLDKFDAHVKKDNDNKRIILFTDADKYVQYKSVYVKHKDMLKVIDKDKGVVYHGTNDHKTVSKDEGKHQSKHETKADEMSIIKDQIDVDKYHVETVKDNQHKQIRLYKEDNGKVAYKSIFDKKGQWLKIIDTDGGLIFNEQI